MLGVDGVVLDRGVEPEAVALLAVVEGALERLLLAPGAGRGRRACRGGGAWACRRRPRRRSSSSELLVGRRPRRPRPRLPPARPRARRRPARRPRRAGRAPRDAPRRRRPRRRPAASPGTSSCSRLKLRMSPTETSSWWAIQASVRPWRTQVRIWLSCGFSDLRAKRRRRLPIPTLHASAAANG